MSLGRTIADALREEAGMDESRALDLAQRIIAFGVRIGNAGRNFYWPAAFTPFEVAERNAAIRAEFNGRNLRELCARYDVSHQTVYRIVRLNKDD